MDVLVGCARPVDTEGSLRTRGHSIWSGPAAAVENCRRSYVGNQPGGIAKEVWRYVLIGVFFVWIRLIAKRDISVCLRCNRLAEPG
jgi:hypothetical protein